MVELEQLEFQKNIIREELLEQTKQIDPLSDTAHLYKSSLRKKRLMRKMMIFQEDC